MSPEERVAVIRAAAIMLVSAGPTASGGTMILPNSETFYLSIGEARQICAASAEGELQQ